MLRIIFTFFSLVLLTIFFSACQQENLVNPVSSVNNTLNKGAVEYSATGSGHFLYFDELRVFSFNAKIKDGIVSGHFNLYRHDVGVHIGGSVICLNIQDNVAYFAGVVEVSNQVDPNFDVGSFVMWSTIDNGEGVNNPPDQVSLVLGSYLWTQEDVENYCSMGSSFGYLYYDVVDGNIQIH